VRVSSSTESVFEPALAEKLAFLGRADSYPHSPPSVLVHETHMSLVFLAGDLVYKLKKPVRFPYLDFSTLDRREAACRAELRLNRRLARDVYLDVVPLTADGNRLSLSTAGTVVDWLVVMRRLDEKLMLDHLIQSAGPDRRRLDELVTMLVRFYRSALPVSISSASFVAGLQKGRALNRTILLDRRLGCPCGGVIRIDRTLGRFLRQQQGILRRRICDRHIVDGHGDLRPEHIWLGNPPAIIDCLEFNPTFRALDPLDEIAFLALECERLGAAWAGDYLHRKIMRTLHERLNEPLYLFYRCHRAMLRARLAVAHLLEPAPRTPEKWPRMARAYLRLAMRDAVRLEGFLRSAKGRRAGCSRAGAGSSRPRAARPAGHRPYLARTPR
jgi:aminoglycoside phosphotransferase family enzyme